MDFNVVVTDKEIGNELFWHHLVREDLTTEELASLATKWNGIKPVWSKIPTSSCEDVGIVVHHGCPCCI